MTQGTTKRGSRRGLLIGGLVVGGGYLAVNQLGPMIADLLADDFVFEPLERPEGYRRLANGQSSRGFDPLFGISDGLDEALAARLDKIERRMEAALFGQTDWPAGVVPLASFSDYNCPFCRLLTPRLAALEKDLDGKLHIQWHEMPLLGEQSLIAARAALAAKRQGAYVAFHERLMRSAFQPTPAYLATLADDLGIDQTRFMNDMASEAVRQEIEQSLLLARLFGFLGTPSLVVGRTAVQGEIGERALQRLIERERADTLVGL